MWDQGETMVNGKPSNMSEFVFGCFFSFNNQNTVSTKKNSSLVHNSLTYLMFGSISWLLDKLQDKICSETGNYFLQEKKTRLKILQCQMKNDELFGE